MICNKYYIFLFKTFFMLNEKIVNRKHFPQNAYKYLSTKSICIETIIRLNLSIIVTYNNFYYEQNMKIMKILKL